MGWRHRVLPQMAAWPEPRRTKHIEDLAAENDVAESFNFVCLQDPRRPFGYSYFKRHDEFVFECSLGWVHVTVVNQRYTSHRYFRELAAALVNQEPYAWLEAYGVMAYADTSANPTTPVIELQS